MLTVLRLYFLFPGTHCVSRAELHAEILALQHQLLVLQCSTQGRQAQFRVIDRVFWVWLSRLWQGRYAMVRETVHRQLRMNAGERALWRHCPSHGRMDRLTTATRLSVGLIAKVHSARPRLVLGGSIPSNNPSNEHPRSPHGPTLTLAKCLCRETDRFIRRDCLDHVLVFNEQNLRRILKSYFDYYEQSRTHLSLKKDSPAPRPVQPPQLGRVIELPQVGGLHHRYERRAA
jgi:hypothetical protein